MKRRAPRRRAAAGTPRRRASAGGRRPRVTGADRPERRAARPARPLLPTSTIGSFPKPEALTQARARLSRGEIDPAVLRRLEEEATIACLRLQERLGLDLLVDGEMYRGDMTAYFAEHLPGFAISGLVRSYGNRYYRKPVVVGPVRFKRPVTVDWFRFAQSHTDRPVKAILTGPYTMMDWSFNEHYPSREALALALAEVIHQEAAALAEAGAAHVQIDEPAISVRPDEIDLAIRAMRIVTRGLRARTITHICYGDFAAIYPRLLDLPVDQFTLEMSNLDHGLHDLFRADPFTKELGVGVIDVHTHAVESVEQVEERIRAALAVVPAERLAINPDCGLKTRSPAEAEAKLRVMMEATRALRAEIARRG
jgi:5-methyltetrahydropteroyltriglutamate--homocysteine methyltransferase